MAEQKQTRMVADRMAASPMPRAMAAAPTLTPKDIAGILRRHILLIISLTTVGLIVGTAGWFLLKMYFPRYTATALIRVLSPVDKNPKVIGGMLVAKDIQYGYRVSMASIITQQSTLQGLLDRDNIKKTNWFQQFGQSQAERTEKAFKGLKKKLGASPSRDAEYIVLSMTCGDRKESALIVNEMMDYFLSLQGSSKRDAVSSKLTGLNDQMVNLNRDLRSAEQSLDDIRGRYKINDLAIHQYQDTITTRLNSLEIEQDRLSQDIEQTRRIIRNFEQQATGPVNEQVEALVERDPTMILLMQQQVQLESTLAGRLTKFGENHRVVRQTQELINETKARREIRKAEIAEQTRQSNLKNAQDQLTIFLGQFEESKRRRDEVAREKENLDLARIQYERAVAIRDERKKQLDDTKSAIEEYKGLLTDPETPKVQSMGRAPEPIGASFPKWKIFLPGGTMLGFMFGIALAFLIEMLNDLVRTPRDVDRYLHIPLLGVIPDVDEDYQAQDIELCHIVRQAPYSIISESYRRLRTNLKLSDSAGSARVLLVCSGVPEEGATSVAVNLTTSFAAENKKVLLIDANFWRPSLHKIFPKTQTQPSQPEAAVAGESEFGLSTLLTGLCGYSEVIRTSGIPGLDIINTGLLPSNPAELLGSVQMEQLIKHQRQSYDYVFVDGPPVLLVSEAKMLARFVDAAILVFSAASTRRGAALRTIRELKEVNAFVAGCALFAVKSMKGGYFQEMFNAYKKYQKPQLAYST
jgi:capsular exopolysaccharide synthesis family protein